MHISIVYNKSLYYASSFWRNFQKINRLQKDLQAVCKGMLCLFRYGAYDSRNYGKNGASADDPQIAHRHGGEGITVLRLDGVVEPYGTDGGKNDCSHGTDQHGGFAFA